MRHRQRPFPACLSILLAAAIVFAGVAARVVSASPAGLDSEVSSFIASEFPDRKTSSYDSQRLTSYVRAQLETNGWQAEILPYSVLVRSAGPTARDVNFTQVSGENVLAFAPGQSGTTPVDLLIVAPYDTLLRETGYQEETSYTARATAALLSFAALGNPAAISRSVNLAIAFVSGHYQYGAGTIALLNELTSARGLSVKAALALGDLDALDALPITVGEETPSGLVRSVHEAARANHAPVTVVGPRTRESWYGHVMTPGSGASSTESMLDMGVFRGEAALLTDKGVPALTLGTPRNNMDLPLAQASACKGLDAARVLLDLATSSDPAALAAGPPISSQVVVQSFGRLYLVPRQTVLVAGAIASLAVVALLVLRAGRMRNLAPLAVLGGVLFAMVIAHPLRSLWFSGDPGKRYLRYRPRAALFLYVWSGLAVVMLGIFRIWRIRARISYLRSRIPSPAPAATPDAGSQPDAASGDDSSGTAGSWAGPWGLATLAAVVMGTSLVGSELAVPALVATLGLFLSVSLDHPERYGRAATLAIRIPGTLASLALLLWAGPPFGADAARVYSLSLGRFGTEEVALTVVLAVFVSCLVSSFRLPAPAARKGMALANVAEAAIMVAFIAAGLLIPRSGADAVPARAVIREYLGNEGRITLDTSRPLGSLTLLPEGIAPAVPGVPDRVQNRVASETYRLGGPTAASAWANIAWSTAQVEKGEEGNTVRGTVTAAFGERPTFYQLAFRDVPATRNITAPFRLENLAEVIGVGDAAAVVADGESTPGSSITVTWWMPAESTLSRDFHLSIPSSSRADVLGRATYVDRSYSGLNPVSPNTRFTLVTYVTGLTIYR